MYKHVYIIEIEHRLHDIYIAKFYIKSHRNSDNRYNLTLNKVLRNNNEDHGGKNFLRILNTLIKISGVILKKNENASFGFIGAPRFIEMDSELNAQNINDDGTYRNTIRFRVYKSFVLRYFSPEKYQHIEFINSSAYLIKNLKNLDLTEKVAQKALLSFLNES